MHQVLENDSAKQNGFWLKNMFTLYFHHLLCHLRSWSRHIDTIITMHFEACFYQPKKGFECCFFFCCWCRWSKSKQDHRHPTYAQAKISCTEHLFKKWAFHGIIFVYFRLFNTVETYVQYRDMEYWNRACIVYRNLLVSSSLGLFIAFTIFWFLKSHNLLTLCRCQWIRCLF